MNRFWKTFGKLITYIGFIGAIGGMEFRSASLFLIGVGMVIVGCIVHEINE